MVTDRQNVAVLPWWRDHKEIAIYLVWMVAMGGVTGVVLALFSS